MTEREFNERLKTVQDEYQFQYYLDYVSRNGTTSHLAFDPEPATPKLDDQDEDYILSVKDVLKFVPVNRSTLWRMVRKGRFPEPLRVAQTRRLGWRWSTVQAWIKAQNP